MKLSDLWSKQQTTDDNSIWTYRATEQLISKIKTRPIRFKDLRNYIQHYSICHYSIFQFDQMNCYTCNQCHYQWVWVPPLQAQCTHCAWLMFQLWTEVWGLPNNTVLWYSRNYRKINCIKSYILFPVFLTKGRSQKKITNFQTLAEQVGGWVRPKLIFFLKKINVFQMVQNGFQA